MGTVPKNDLVWTKKYHKKDLKNDKIHEKNDKVGSKSCFLEAPFLNLEKSYEKRQKQAPRGTLRRLNLT